VEHMLGTELVDRLVLTHDDDDDQAQQPLGTPVAPAGIDGAGQAVIPQWSRSRLLNRVGGRLSVGELTKRDAISRQWEQIHVPLDSDDDVDADATARPYTADTDACLSGRVHRRPGRKAALDTGRPRTVEMLGLSSSRPATASLAYGARRQTRRRERRPRSARPSTSNVVRPWSQGPRHVWHEHEEHQDFERDALVTSLRASLKACGVTRHKFERALEGSTLQHHSGSGGSFSKLSIRDRYLNRPSSARARLCVPCSAVALLTGVFGLFAASGSGERVSTSDLRRRPCE